MRRMLPVLAVLICFVALPASAARKDKPTNKEVADRAKGAKLDTANATMGEKCKFTPADLGHVKNMTELEDGQIIGVLETETASDKTNLPAGKYNLFLAKVGNNWHVYAESGGTIVAEAYSVVERKDTPKGMKPKFNRGSFCWWVWLIFTGFQLCV